MLDFEWVIVDALYEQRKDYFTNLKLPFKVKHVPALPNLWIEKGLPGIATQFNKGIIYADGQLLFFVGDGFMLQPSFTDQLWKRYTEGYFPLAWYFYDLTYDIVPGEALTLSTPDTRATILEPASRVYNIAGYSGKKVEVDFRYIEAFHGKNIEVYPAGWNWWYGSSTASLEAMLKINGFDQKFDGDRGLSDCDVGSRLDLAGYGMRFALFKELYMIRATAKREWNPSFDFTKSIKCNYPLIWLSRFFKQYEANKHVLTERDIKWIKEYYCPKKCTGREYCKKEHVWQYPFEHKAGYGHNSSKLLFNFWKKHQTLISLTDEREKRLSENKKYVEGTFV
jgi:hypothetical protein